jgi:tripartite-type tricarboxylate transporter receptor subunit TctC
VPYRGSAPAANDLIGGQIDYLCGNLGAAAPLIFGKQVKALAVLIEGALGAHAGLGERA